MAYGDGVAVFDPVITSGLFRFSQPLSQCKKLLSALSPITRRKVTSNYACDISKNTITE